MVADIEAMTVARVCLELGSGRRALGDEIDHCVGLILEVQVGESVEEGDPLLVIYHRGELPAGLSESLASAFILSEGEIELQSRITDIIR